METVKFIAKGGKNIGCDYSWKFRIKQNRFVVIAMTWQFYLKEIKSIKKIAIGYNFLLDKKCERLLS